MIQRNTPELFVQDVDEAVRFYVDALGFEREGRVPEDESKPGEWAMVRQGDVAFMFEKVDEKRSPHGVVFYLAVDDTRETAEALRSRGAIVQGPVEQWYGMREATVNDPNGYKLVFTSPVAVSETAKA